MTPNKALHTTPRLRLGLKVRVHFRGVCELWSFGEMETFGINLVFLDGSMPNRSIEGVWLPRVGEYLHFGGPDGPEYFVKSVTYVVLDRSLESVILRLDSPSQATPRKSATAT